MQVYSDVINPHDYTSGLMKHLWIPQVDAITVQKIISKTQQLLDKGLSQVRIVDLGCGPGRLTNRIAKLITHEKVKIIGVDSDAGFLEQAIIDAIGIPNIEYKQTYLPTGCPNGEIFLCYGVWHHLDNVSERVQRKDMIVDSLSKDGSLFLGDEFLAPYINEEHRVKNAVLLYMNVIGDAYSLAGCVDELVKIEVLNLIEDLAASNYGNGVIRDEDISNLAQQCLKMKIRAEIHGYNSIEINSFMLDIIEYTKIAYNAGMRCESRGDYKISIDEQVMQLGSGLKLNNTAFSGNPQTYGGMGLLEFGHTKQ